MIRREIDPEELSEEKKEHAPIMTTWKGEPMIRLHSIRAAVKEILQVANTLEKPEMGSFAQGLDVVKIGIIGEPSTGKSALEDTIACLAHSISPIPYAVRSFGKEEFLDFDNTLAGLSPANYILKFRDLSFLTANANKRDIEKVKQVVTEIRHLPGGQDVKIILIYDYHYTLGLDKYLRQSDFKFFTSMGSSEQENMINIVGSKYTKRVEDFARIYNQCKTKKIAQFRIGPKSFHTYQWRKPFAPVLFWNGLRLRYVVYPLRTWIKPICTICTEGDNASIKSQVPVDQFIKESEAKFGPCFKQAVKIKMFQNGINTYGRTVSQAIKYLDKALNTKIIPLEKLAIEYGLEITRTKLRKKLDGVLED